MRHLVFICALLALSCQGCVTGYLYLDNEKFRDGCGAADSCAKAIAIEATAEVGAALIIATGIAIANAMDDSDEEGLEQPLEQAEPAPAPAKPPSSEEYPGWP